MAPGYHATCPECSILLLLLLCILLFIATNPISCICMSLPDTILANQRSRELRRSTSRSTTSTKQVNPEYVQLHNTHKKKYRRKAYRTDPLVDAGLIPEQSNTPQYTQGGRTRDLDPCGVTEDYSTGRGTYRVQSPTRKRFIPLPIGILLTRRR